MPNESKRSKDHVLSYFPSPTAVRAWGCMEAWRQCRGFDGGVIETWLPIFPGTRDLGNPLGRDRPIGQCWRRALLGFVVRVDTMANRSASVKAPCRPRDDSSVKVLGARPYEATASRGYDSPCLCRGLAGLSAGKANGQLIRKKQRRGGRVAPVRLLSEIRAGVLK